jgi:Fe-S cluster assembly protein SufD
VHSLRTDHHADSHTFIEHCEPNTRSDQLYKCILEDESHSVFNGRILVDPKAQLTNSYQLNKNLLLSRECRVDTKPQLEIGADDVKCTHGATIGQLNEDEIFYLETRGIKRDEARRMIIKGFIDELISRIESPFLRGRVAMFTGHHNAS